ncbi:MAG TPA: GNAT family N-acetyltransferase [candidate division Zixibacteria bacterium]|nr:GNAT family N-acetyltransferase [candidate division Zixibacteria bacterium]
MSDDNKDYIIEQFTLEDSEIDKYAKLITDALLADEAAQEEGATIVFTEQTFKTIFGGPTIDRRLFIRTIFRPTNELVGFLGSIKKDLSIKGKTYNTAIPAWLSVQKAHQRKGIAKAMGIKILEYAKKFGYDGGFAFHEPKQRGIDTSKAVSRETGVPIFRLFSLNQFIVRVYDVEAASKCIKLKWYEKLVFKLFERIGKVKSANIRLYKPEDFDQIFELTMDLVKRTEISIVPIYEDLKWMIGNPNVLCVVHENNEGKIDGYILVWEFTFAGFGNQVPFGWLDTVHTYNLTNNEVKNLANFLSQEAIKKGWKGIQTPYIPYFNAKPFKRANFIFFRKKLGLDLFNITGFEIPEKVNTFYFIWR